VLVSEDLNASCLRCFADEDLIRVHKEVMSMFLSSNLLFPGPYFTVLSRSARLRVWGCAHHCACCCVGVQACS
jgi:hypothetical protein